MTAAQHPAGHSAGHSAAHSSGHDGPKKDQAKNQEPAVVKYAISHACNLCGVCRDVCPTQAIFFGRNHFVIDTDSCDGSTLCMVVCPVNAIHPIRNVEPEKPDQKGKTAPQKKGK